MVRIALSDILAILGAVALVAGLVLDSGPLAAVGGLVLVGVLAWTVIKIVRRIRETSEQDSSAAPSEHR